MIEETGEIIFSENNLAIVKVEQKAACQGCSAKNICHPFDSTEDHIKITAKNQINAKKGDIVKVAIPEGKFLKASFITYLIPIIFLIAGSFVGEILFKNDFFNFLIGGIFFIVSFFIIHSYSKKREYEFLPEIIEIIDRI